MIKGKTGLTVFLEFVQREGRIPTKEEFVDLGYTRRWFYKVREQYYNYLEEEAKRSIKHE